MRCDRGTYSRECARFDPYQDWCIDQTCWLGSTKNKSEEWNDEVPRLKKRMSKVIKDTHASGRESMDMILSECLNAVNEITRHGGFAPALWVLSRLPRNPSHHGSTKDVGALQVHADWTDNLRLQSHHRARARLRCAVTLPRKGA